MENKARAGTKGCPESKLRQVERLHVQPSARSGMRAHPPWSHPQPTVLKVRWAWHPLQRAVSGHPQDTWLWVKVQPCDSFPCAGKPLELGSGLGLSTEDPDCGPILPPTEEFRGEGWASTESLRKSAGTPLRGIHMGIALTRGAPVTEPLHCRPPLSEGSEWMPTWPTGQS